MCVMSPQRKLTARHQYLLEKYDVSDPGELLQLYNADESRREKASDSLGPALFTAGCILCSSPCTHRELLRA